MLQLCGTRAGWPRRTRHLAAATLPVLLLAAGVATSTRLSTTAADTDSDMTVEDGAVFNCDIAIAGGSTASLAAAITAAEVPPWGSL